MWHVLANGLNACMRACMMHDLQGLRIRVVYMPCKVCFHMQHIGTPRHLKLGRNCKHVYPWDTLLDALPELLSKYIVVNVAAAAAASVGSY